MSTVRKSSTLEKTNSSTMLLRMALISFVLNCSLKVHETALSSKPSLLTFELTGTLIGDCYLNGKLLQMKNFNDIL